MGKRSRFIDEMGAPKMDLRSKPKCAICGTKITSNNFGVSETSLDEGKWTEAIYFCEECFLKHIAKGDFEKFAKGDKK